MTTKIETQLDRIESMLNSQKAIMTLAEFCRYTGLSKSAAYKLTHGRKISYSCPNGKVIYFNKADVEAYMLKNRIPSSEEIEKAATNYVTLHPNRFGGASR